MDASYKEKAEQLATEFAAGATSIGELKNWKQALNHFAILFPDRMPKDYQA